MQRGHLQVDIHAIREDMRLGVLPIPQSSAKVLLTRDPGLLESGYIEQVSGEDQAAAVQFPQAVSRALLLIADAAPELADRISATISWYVAIDTADPQVHCSFTSPQLKGVIFLSHTEIDLVLAEAIVHEFGHTELNTVMDTETLSCEDAAERFYSPWRTDPRPLSGLIHALYVFSGVLEFLGQVAARPALSRHWAYAQAERATIFHRLRIGLMQVPDEKLTALGREIVRDIRQRVMRQRNELRAGSREVPGHIYKHLEAWRAEHPELASAVRTQ
jgi:HEXXH motif-containing protein